MPVSAQITQQLQYNSTGSQVAELQTDLKKLGLFSSTIDGNFQYSTCTAVKNFQSNTALTASGALDFTTLNKLNKVLSGEPAVLSYGMTHDKVKELQYYLYFLGYLTVNPTGYYGSLTTSAVSKLQSERGLPVTGKADSSTFQAIYKTVDAKCIPSTTCTSYTIVSGDNSWSIARKFGITQNDFLKANNLTESSMLSIGQTVKIPHVNVPVKPAYGNYGEYLDWFTAAQYVFPTGQTATVIDYFSGKSFNIKRTIGSGHADCEPLTAADTAAMKDIFGGSWTWTPRPIVVIVNGRKLAAAMAGMPHAGLDAYPSDANVSNRSGGYGYGPNFDYIKGNNMDGHFCVHFPGSLRHADWQVDPVMQAMIKIAADR